ncbi:phage tail terminator-like protein [uncultured Paraglaciecola sp.]|uniref:phage tail terminator-like protein n=1 Tax=uncultured Paraglaciecola sp. TaxID=1765024 RepID=UPI002604D2AD|nr:phage tail terminator-like protein [uncultured Paraglaciecola sp.]
MTTLDQAQQAINDRFIAAWGSTTPFSFTNEMPASNDISTSWVRLVSRLAVSGQRSLGQSGNRKYDRNGIIFVQVFSPINQGSSSGTALAKQIEDLYEGERFNGVVGQDSIIRDIGPDGEWYQLQVEINFTYEEIK